MQSKVNNRDAGSCRLGPRQLSIPQQMSIDSRRSTQTMGVTALKEHE